VTTRQRLDNALGLLKGLGCDGLLLNSRANVSYMAGFDAPDALLIITHRDAVLMTDFRYSADFKRRAPSFLKIVEYKNGLFENAAKRLLSEKAGLIGFESRHLVFEACEVLHRCCGKAVTLVPLKETVEPLRELKSPEELRLIRKALQINLKALRFAETKLKPGITEREVAADLECFIRRAGARSSAFDIIVASGPNASYPHASVTDRKLKNGEPVIIDMGVDYEGYKCDLTRTFFLGRIPPIVRRVAALVAEAQKISIKRIKPGVPLKVVDAAARSFISQKGYGRQFGHALGHGVGLEVHEGPAVNKKNDCPAKPGMVFTVEPGIYLTGRFGVRMEEMVLVTAKGVEVLSGHAQH